NSTYNFTNALYGAVNRVESGTSQSGSINLAMGSVSDVYHDGNGSVAFAKGIAGTVYNRSGGIVSDAQNEQFGVLNAGAGSITTGYGVYISTVAGTTNYGLYQEDATAENYFAGKVGIGTLSPHTALHVV